MRKVAVAALLLILVLPTRAQAQATCGHSVVFTIPGITWQDLERQRPPEVLAAIDDGSAAALAVRTNEPITDYASGFLTIGTGSRANVPGGVGGPASSDGLRTDGGRDEDILEPGSDVRLGGFEEILDLADEAGYGAKPGSLASSLEPPVIAVGNSDPGSPVPTPYGFGRYALLAATHESGVVDLAFTDTSVTEPDPSSAMGVRTDPVALLEATERALDTDDCAVVIVDPGDLVRADMASHIAQEELRDERSLAMTAADSLLGEVRALLDENDQLLIASPNSPMWDEDTHLGVAIAVGPGFEPGSTLRSASTNRDGIVTLPDIAPTILEYQGVARPSEMLGRPWLSTAAAFDDPVAGFARFDREAVFAHGTGPAISTVYVIAQVILYALAIALLWARESKPEQPPWLMRGLQFGALGVVAFPLATYLATPVQGHDLGGWWFAALLLAIDALLVVIVWFALRTSMDRLFALIASTFALMVVDQTIGGPLQLNAVWGIDPITAGRFSGLGNISFAILGTTGLLTGALLLRRYEGRRWALYGAAGVFALTVIVDGAPSLGSDVGGVLALVPALGLSFLLLTGKRPTAKTVVIVVIGAILTTVAFLVVDLSRPEESRTHLARLYEDVRDRGPGAFTDVILRKARANLRLFRKTIWTYLVPVALGLLAYLVLRPKGAWQRMAGREPKLRAALIGGMLVGIFGFAVNDSGIVVPAMALSYLVPLALAFHLAARRDPA